MPIASSPDLLALLRLYHLLEPDQLDQLEREADALRLSPADLARRLVRQGWLTTMQVNYLFQDKGDALRLGSYVLLEKLGEGGMGAVFKAKNWKLGRVVALKVIRKGINNAEMALRRFQREITAAAQMSHPNVVRALDAGEADGVAFFVLEYAAGVDLYRLVQQRGPLSVEDACDCARQTALGLQHLHERGLVHRDIKPPNLLRTDQGVVKILDLGMARLDEGLLLGKPVSSITEEGQVLGTPDFMAPEQTTDASRVDIRADLYSLGCTLHFLLTGQPPFPGNTLGEKIAHHLMTEPPRLESRRPGVPRGLATVARVLLAKRPEERFQTPAELALALAQIDMSDTAVAAPQTVWDPALAVLDLPTTEPTRAPVPRPARRGRPWGRWLLAAVPVALLLALLGWLLLRERDVPLARPDTVEVSAAGGWQDSGLDVTEDEEVTLIPSGVWRKGQEACSAAGLKRTARSRGIVPDAPHLCLLARVGDEAVPRAIAQREAIRFGRTGRLYFRINDLESDGHNGALQVRVEGGTPGPELAAPPPTAEEGAAARLGVLRERLGKETVDAEQLFQEVLGLEEKYGGTWHARHARLVLARERGQRSSPLDHLDGGVAEEHKEPGQPDNLVAVLGSRRQRHWGFITSVAASKDGKRLASGGEDGTIRLWDPATLSQTGVLRGHTEQVRALVFTPDHRFLISGGIDGTIRVWDLGTLEALSMVPTGKGRLITLGLSADGRTLASPDTNKGQFVLWDLREGKLTARQRLTFQDAATYSSFPLALSSDGSLLAVADNQRVRLWEVGKSQPRAEMPAPQAYALAFSPDGRRLAAGGMYGIGVWNVAGAKPAPEAIPEPIRDMYSLAFSPDGRRLAVGDGGGMLTVWDVTGEKLASLAEVRAHFDAVYGLAFLPDGRLFTGGVDRTVRLWDLAGARPRELFPPAPIVGLSTAPAFSPDGRHLAFGSLDGKVHVWDLSRQPLREAPCPRPAGAAVAHLVYSPNSRRLAACGMGFVELLDVGPRPGAAVTLEPPSRGMCRVALSPDGQRLAAGATNGLLTRWDLAASPPRPESPLTKAEQGSPLLALAFSLDGKMLAAGLPSGTIGLWDVTTAASRALPETARRHTALVLDLAFSPDGETLASAGRYDGQVRLWDLRRQPPVLRATLPAFVPWVVSLAWSPDGERLYTLDARGEIVEWRDDKPQRKWSLPGPGIGLGVSPDGRLLAITNANSTVYLLRLRPPRAAMMPAGGTVMPAQQLPRRSGESPLDAAARIVQSHLPERTSLTASQVGPP